MSGSKRITWPLLIICLIATAVVSVYLVLPRLEGPSLEFLRSSGKTIATESGRIVRLRGVNIAAYGRIGPDLLKEEDIERIAGWGANSVRLALHYKFFEDDATPFQFKEDSFLILDKVLDWFEKHRVYVILDIHVAQGGQSTFSFAGPKYEFWKIPTDQERFIGLWKAIAGRYVDRPVVAGYDLMNEPVVPSVESYVNVTARTIDAIRSVDKRHIIIVETIHGIVGKKSGQEFILIPTNDHNLMYSFHFYFPTLITHYYLSWRGRDIASYPGERVTGGKSIATTNSASVNGTADWKSVSADLRPPKGADVAVVLLRSEKNQGTVWFDDVELQENTANIELPAAGILDGSFEAAGELRWSNWTTVPGTTIVRDNKVAHSGSRSLRIVNSIGETTISSRFFMVNGSANYKLSAWIKASKATGRNYIAIRWYERQVVERYDNGRLEVEMKYATEFMDANSVPIYLGEFGAQQNPNRNYDINWVRDVLDISEKKGFHWAYWDYLSGGERSFSIMYGTRMPGVADHVQNFEVLEILKQYFNLQMTTSLSTLTG